MRAESFSSTIGTFTTPRSRTFCQRPTLLQRLRQPLATGAERQQQVLRADEIMAEPNGLLAGQDLGKGNGSKKEFTFPVRWVYLDIGKFHGLAETIDESIRYPIRTPRDRDETARMQEVITDFKYYRVALRGGVFVDTGVPAPTARGGGRTRSRRRQSQAPAARRSNAGPAASAARHRRAGRCQEALGVQDAAERPADGGDHRRTHAG